jgi:uncharacterized membrane protein YGL010W
MRAVVGANVTTLSRFVDSAIFCHRTVSLVNLRKASSFRYGFIVQFVNRE